MKIPQLLSVFRIILLVSTVFAISTCADTAAVVRKVTYPPDFKYVSGQELRSGMEQLAFQLQLLDQTLAKSNPEPLVQQQQVSGILLNIERIGANLRAGEAGSNHPFLQDHMSNFVTDVSQARIAVSMNPPRYYMAGRIAGSCLNCHKVNR